MLFWPPRALRARAVSPSPADYRVSRGLSASLRRRVGRPGEESELFPGLKQAQIVANLCVLGAPSTREEEWISQGNKNTGGSINPPPLVRSDLFSPDVSRCLAQVMVIIWPCIFNPPLPICLFINIWFLVWQGK